ncbi:PP2C family protein-serine/threonine phosphatase [Thalassiella azotivora]
MLKYLRRRVLPSQAFQLLGFTALAVVASMAALVVPEWVPVTASTVVIMLGGFFLRIRSLLMLYLVVGSALAYVVVNRIPSPSPGQIIVIGLTAVLVLVFANSRERLGVQGTLGESMLVDLRDRLRAQGTVPPLPRQWQVETVLRSAYGDSFSGDFLVSTRSTDDRDLEMALVDVSGKGQAAGTRALLLSGAFGGLLGAMDQTDFLPAANAYLLRQRWDEGFATAVHLCVDLSTGAYRLASAGHPPAAHFHAGSGRWEVIASDHGPALGIVDTVEFPAHHGILRRGDALLMYTDGLVETPGRDLTLGIDRLMGQAERLVRRGGFRGGADRIVDGTRTGESDDRALVLLWRE